MMIRLPDNRNVDRVPSTSRLTAATRATMLCKRAMMTHPFGHGNYFRCSHLRLPLLERALKLYSFGLSSCDADGAHRKALCKNIGMTCLRLGQAHVESGCVGEEDLKDTRKIIFYVKGCVQNLTLNWVWRPKERELEWGEQLSGYINAAFDVAFRSLWDPTDKKWSKQLHHLDAVLKEIGADPSLHKFRLQFHTDRAQFYHRSALKILEKNKFILATSVIEYCRCDIELAKKYASLVDDSDSAALEYHLKEMENVMKFLEASCESVKLRTAADELLESALNDSEEVNFELMWDILDMFKGAAIAASNEDIKNETIAIARQGLLFHKIFKLETYAKLYCRKAMELGNVIVDGECRKWFRQCCGVIAEYQRRQREEEQRERDKERAPYLEQLVKELGDLKSVADDSFKLMKHIYAVHPPKQSPDFKYDENQVNPETVKKALVKAIFHYHPDKQVTYEKKWQILCDEITKCLTRKYEAMKGM